MSRRLKQSEKLRAMMEVVVVVVEGGWRGRRWGCSQTARGWRESRAEKEKLKKK